MFFSTRELLKILSSTALSNGFLIVLSLSLAHFAEANEYGQFAYGVSVFAVSSLLLDFGLNISAIKRHSDFQVSDTPLTFASIKLILATAIFLLVLINSVISEYWFFYSPLIVGFICASINNVWLALRVVDQSSGDTSTFFRANVNLFLLRLATVICTYFADLTALHYLLALYLYPHLILLPLTPALFDFKSHLKAFKDNVWQIFAYSKWIFVSALLFVGSVQIPILSLKSPETELEMATLGVAMSIASLSSWLSYSLKPFFIGHYLSREAKDGAFSKLLVHFCIAMVPLVVLVYFSFLFAFGNKYPNVELIGSIIFIYSSLVFVLGLYNSQIHVSGRPDLEALINLVRACIVLFIMMLNTDLLQLMLMVGATMVALEVILMGVNHRLMKSKNENSIS